MEYTEVLQENDTVHIYGDTLLQSDDNDIVTGLNESVIARVSEDVKKITYSDYGNTDDIVKGHGYNSEMKDSSGLIYLRARYYDPGISRFVQIDNNYDGEKESIASQNKYVYTLNNPYKYVDRDGNIPFKSPFTICRPKLPIKNKPVKILPKVKKELAKKEQPLPKIETGISKNKASIKGGGSVTKKPAPRNIVISADCPEKEQDIGSKALDVLQKVLDFIGWIPGLGDICDGINAAISFFRNDFVGAIISVTCIVFTVVADALLKPLKNSKLIQKVVQVIKDKFGSGVSKIANFVGSIAKKIKDVPFIGKLLDGATKALNKFRSYIDNLFNKGVSGANQNFKYELDIQLFAKKDIKQIQDIASKYNMTAMQRREFGDYIESLKDLVPNNKNFTWDELNNLAKEFLGGK